MKPSLTVVTPWFNHRELDAGYWQAMHSANARVIVIDNGSQPPLPNGYRLDENTGFSRACNLGLELARTDAVLFLNNDIIATNPNWLDPIVAELEDGVLVGADLCFDPHGDVDGTSFPYLDGWCIGGIRQDLLELGGWSTDYLEPSYYGDNDLCLRARMAGMTLRQVDVDLTHLRNRTAGPADDPAVAVASNANRQRFASIAREALLAA
jgi:GT2 family glycosyltransferase